jgi:hypothetical protein
VLLVFAVSFGYLLFFFCTAGARLGLALLIVGLTLTYHMVWAKMRAETGIGFNSLNFPVTLNNLVQMPFGSSGKAGDHRDLTRWSLWAEPDALEVNPGTPSSARRSPIWRRPRGP